MLKLVDIKKDYLTGDNAVHALKGVSLEFRESEFVAVEGVSGCGKSSLLNIIGGLDQYTSGDLIINGKSTKHFTDGDWDAYRNHSIGFVFQSYNLIPHQSVLSNVELALTLSGVSPSERKRRAIDALEKVGLGDQIYKRPNQMSGGQMQRVAIARALVNNPDILLADEPTGALDTHTSVQIMDLLKEISQNRLIIMVTHNPDLANQYATRIIRLRDGEVISDSSPYRAEESLSPKRGKMKKTSMSFLTALGLSTNNLLTKKTRTLLTAFAGSIGIIGIALIMSLSNGIQNYIDFIQKDTLSSYPLQIFAESMDMSTLVTSLMGTQASKEENQHEKDAVYSSTVLYSLMNSIVNSDTKTNNLRPFKAWINNPESEIYQYISAIQYSYDLDMNLYAKDLDGKITKTDTAQLMQNAMSATFGGDYSAFFSSSYSQLYSVMDAWSEIRPGANGELVDPQIVDSYDLLYGHWPQKYDEAVLMIDQNNEVSDLVLYAIGLKSTATLSDDMQMFLSEQNLRTEIEAWSYEDVCKMSFRYIYPADMYRFDEEIGEYVYIGDEELSLANLYQNGLEVKIVGIIRPDADSNAGISGAVYYTHALIEHVVEEAKTKELVRKQLADETVDVFSGLPYLEGDEALTNNKKIKAAKEYIAAASEEEIADVYIAFMSVPPEGYLDELVDEQMSETSREDIENMILSSNPGYSGMISQLDDDMLFSFINEMMAQNITEAYGEQMRELYEKLDDSELVNDFHLLALDNDDYLWIYNNAIPPVYSENKLKDNYRKLGFVDLDDPNEIVIYASSFEDKDSIATAIEHYNDLAMDDNKIEYTDLVATLMSSITNIINVITYVLIAFVAISLVVSSIMIGIITYISVLERTKEIGILRAIGASKRDVSRVFNAETVIIGLGAGVIGVVLTILANIPITAIVHDLTGIMVLKAELPVSGAAFLIAVSMALTFIAGLIPSGMAARKDPVEALRTE
ncbi:MAG: ABC transporter ATP-binding protein/permease [Oscillospiraceae bacterium]|nr:ABC transporter ATP-binding protein/permease [Oscillospiraceae bacterium]